MENLSDDYETPTALNLQDLIPNGRSDPWVSLLPAPQSLSLLPYILGPGGGHTHLQIGSTVTQHFPFKNSIWCVSLRKSYRFTVENLGKSIKEKIKEV